MGALWTRRSFLASSSLALAGPAATRVVAADARPVTLAWFPRFSYDSKKLLSAHGSWKSNEGGDAIIWDVTSGRAEITTPQPRGIRTVAWSSTADFILCGGYGKEIRYYEAANGKLITQITVASQTEGLALLSDDKRFVSTHGDGSAVLWDTVSRKVVNTWKGLHANGIWGMTVSRDNKFLATAGQDRTVSVVDLEAMKPVHKLAHPASANGVAFTKDSTILVTGCGDSLIRLFEVDSGKEIGQLKGHQSNTVTDLQFSSDGKLLASAGGDGTVRLWDFADPAKASLMETIEAHNAMAFGVALSPDGKWLASAGWDDQIRLWELPTRKEVWSNKRPV